MLDVLKDLREQGHTIGVITYEANRTLIFDIFGILIATI